MGLAAANVARFPNPKARHWNSVDTWFSGQSQSPDGSVQVGRDTFHRRLRGGLQGNGHAAHRQAAPDGLHPEGERPAPDRGQPADAAAARSHASAGDEGARASGHRGADEEHHAGAVPAGAAGGGGDGLRVRLRRHGPVPRGRLQAARQRRAGAAANPQRVPHLRAARPAGGDRAS